MKAISLFVALCAKVRQQLDGAILLVRNSNARRVRGEHIHVADFSGTLANAREVAKQAALATLWILIERLGGRLQSANAGAQRMHLVRIRALGRLLYQLAQLARRFADSIGVQSHTALPEQ